MYKAAGLKGEGILWLFTDSQITDEKFMVFINDLLSSGEIPDLFPPEDVDDIINAVRGEAKAAGHPDSREAIWSFFIQKVRTNLHMVFTCSPVGEQSSIRAQRFLAMINSTVIDWFQPWPEKALFGVSERFLGEVELGDPEVANAVHELYAFQLQPRGEGVGEIPAAGAKVQLHHSQDLPRAHQAVQVTAAEEAQRDRDKHRSPVQWSGEAH